MRDYKAAIVAAVLVVALMFALSGGAGAPGAPVAAPCPAPAAPAAFSNELSAAEAEVQRQRQRVQQLVDELSALKAGGAGPAPSSPTGEEAQLRREVDELTARLAAAAAVAPAAPTPAPASSGTSLEVTALTKQLRAAEQARDSLQVELAAARAAPSPAPAPAPAPLPAQGSGVPAAATDKFFLYDPSYGRFNNQKVALMLALRLAQMLDRTLVVPRWHPSDEFDTLLLIDYAGLSRHVRLVNMDAFHAYVLPTLKGPDVLYRVHKEGQAFLSVAKLPTGGARTYECPNKEFVYTRIKDAPERVAVANPVYPIAIRQNLYNSPEVQEFRKYIRFHDFIVSAGDAFIRDHLKRPYTAVHLRKLEGECGNRARSVGLGVDRCQPTAQQVTDQVKRQKPWGNSGGGNVYLASDGQDKALLQKLERMLPVVKYQGNYESALKFGRVALDMYLCEVADAFIGNPFSSLSSEVVANRKAKGLGPSEGYNERHTDHFKLNFY